VRFVVLDLSTKTGWAYFEVGDAGLVLLERGQLEPIPEPKHLKLPYPENYLAWSRDVAQDVRDNILSERSFDYLVIEETAKGSLDAHIQKLLEWIHYEIATYIRASRGSARLKNVYYLQTGEWRQTAGCQMTKDEKKRNKRVRDVRKAAKAKGEKVVLVEVKPGEKKVGLVSKKHLTLRRVREIFGIELQVQQNDTADALLIGYAAYKRFFEKDSNESTETKELL
jgi:hypothetical protein